MKKELTALQMLNELARQRKIEKYPTIPVHYLGSINYTDKTTSGLSRCIIDLLRFNNYHVERTGNEGRIIDNRHTYTDVIGNTRTIGSLKRVYSSGTRGTSDLKAIINSKFVAIEIKCRATGDRQSEAQRQYQKQIEASGGVYIIANDFEGFYKWFANFVRKGLNNEK